LRVMGVDLPLEVAVDLSRTEEKPNDPPPTQREKEMFERFEQLERRLAAMEAASMPTQARVPEPQSGQVAPGPPQPGVGKNQENRPLVASLNRVLTTALLPEGSPASGAVPSPTQQQSGGKSRPAATPPAAPEAVRSPTQQQRGKSGPPAVPPTPVAPPQPRISE